MIAISLVGISLLAFAYQRKRKVIPTIHAINLDDELNAILRKKAIRITGHKF